MTNQRFIDRLQDAGVNTAETIDRFMGNEALFLKFIRRLPQILKISEMKKALAEDNGEEFYRWMHDLKGISGNLGLTDVYNAAQASLAEYRSAQLRSRKKIEELLAEIEECCNKVLLVLEEEASESEMD